MTDVQHPLPVTASERVSDVLARDESLVEVFVRHAPHFAKLRNRGLRRVMARLVTVEQAARTARVPVGRLLCDLNDALGLPADRSEPESTASGAPDAGTSARLDSSDASARRPEGAPVVELDVREDLRAGREPFTKIMTAVAELAESHVLHLRTIFEPVPLFTVLGKRGFVHETACSGPDDWSVWFWRPAAVEPAATAVVPEAPATDPVTAPASDDATTFWLDVRGASPPEPMLRTLTALETLPRGHVLVQINSRVPQFLFPVLAERGFACEVDESRLDRVLVRIWHARS